MQILDYHDRVPDIYAFAMEALTDALELFHFAKIWNNIEEQLTSHLFRQVRKQDWVFGVLACAISPASSSCMLVGPQGSVCS